MECKGMERERESENIHFIFQLLLDENTRSQLFCLYITNLTMTVCGCDICFFVFLFVAILVKRKSVVSVYNKNDGRRPLRCRSALSTADCGSSRYCSVPMVVFMILI